MSRLVRAQVKRISQQEQWLTCCIDDRFRGEVFVVDIEDLTEVDGFRCTCCRTYREAPHTVNAAKVKTGLIAGRYMLLDCLDLDEGPLEGAA